VRKNKAFVPVDCSSLVPTLIESELFGYVKGAFTGALQSRVGLIEAANGGTLFLDEIGDLPENLQPTIALRAQPLARQNFVSRCGNSSALQTNWDRELSSTTP
jgi:transcriptional regulator with GAF, ATPase, and Fis domain